jgi:hypothetical protein
MWYNAPVKQYEGGQYMKSLQEAVLGILSQPKPKDFVQLQGILLISGQEGEAVDRALEIAGRFYAYLSDLQSKMAAKDYSEVASRLDIAAVGIVALENMVAQERETFWQRLLLGGLGEALMVGASRQYVKGWQVEAGQVHENAAWYLTGALWDASLEMQPALEPEQRWQAIQTLLAPVHDPGVPTPAKALLLGRIFQVLLLTYLAQLIDQSSEN